MDDIIKAVLIGNTDFVKKILKTDIDINSQDKDKRTALIHAIIDNKLEIADILIQKGAELDHQDSLGYTALHYAVQNSLEDATRLLLEKHAKIDIQDINGNTPLFRAVFNSRGKGEIIKLLLSYGADKTLKNKHGVSPQQLAKTIGNYNVTQFLD